MSEKVKFLYKGISLKQYCKNNNIVYNTIKKRIYIIMEKDNTHTIEELIELALNQQDNNRYYYNGMLFSEYCKENGLNYNTLYQRILKMKKSGNYTNYTNKDLIELALNKKDVKPKKEKFSYDGVSLRCYCMENNFNYKSIISLVKRLKLNEKYNGYSNEELIELALKNQYESKKNLRHLYNGVPLKQYCKDNNLNYDSIIHRIVFLKRKPEYSKYSYNELLELVSIHDYRVSKDKNNRYKYYYKGISLKEYCKKNNIYYMTILKRIRQLKDIEAYRNYNNDELVELAFKKAYKSRKTQKYYYKGLTLKEYCKKNNINYDTIIHRINVINKLEEYKDYNNEELIELALNKNYLLPKKNYINKPRKCKYYYRGIPLTQYCIENKLEYKAIIAKIIYLKKKGIYSEEKLIDFVINEGYKKTRGKYYYSGVSLKEYCQNNNLKYSAILSRLKLLKNSQEYSNFNINELVEIAINGNYHLSDKQSTREANYNIKYYYHGERLVDYCKKNGLNAKLIRNKIGKLKKEEKYNGYSDNELVAIVIEKRYEKKEFYYNPTKYYYNGISLKQYCDENNISYETIISRIHEIKRKKEFSGYSNSKIVEMAIKKGPKHTYLFDTKYMYKGISLLQYCKDNALSYSSIRKKIYRNAISEEYKDYSLDVIIEKAVIGSEKFKKKNEILSLLKKENIKDNEFEEICDYFKLNLNNVKKLSSKLTLEQSVYIVYYFSDLENSLGNKTISLSKIKEVQGIVRKIKSNEEELYHLDLHELLGLYKCKFFDTREAILKRQEKYIYAYIYSIGKEFRINKDIVEDIKSEINLLILKYIDTLNSDNDWKIIGYINRIIGASKKYISEYMKNRNELTLNSPVYEDHKYERLDFITSNKTGFEKIFKEEKFSDKINICLSKLSKPEYNFIMLRFSKNYSYEELAKMFNVSIDKVIKKENSILNKIKKEIIKLHR